MWNRWFVPSGRPLGRSSGDECRIEARQKASPEKPGTYKHTWLSVLAEVQMTSQLSVLDSCCGLLQEMSNQIGLCR